MSITNGGYLLYNLKSMGGNTMTDQRALEIAESFINGNISWVKARTKSKKAFMAVRAYISPDDLESYDRICGRD